MKISNVQFHCTDTPLVVTYLFVLLAGPYSAYTLLRSICTYAMCLLSTKSSITNANFKF